MVNTLSLRKTVGMLLGLVGALTVLSACADGKSPPDSLNRLQKGERINTHFNVLYMDANPARTGVTLFNERGEMLDVSSLLSLKNKSNLVSSRAIPSSVRATWRTGDFVPASGGMRGGTVMGEYTATVAERIPKEVFEYIRQHGGGLRLKFRLVENALLVGWDVEKVVSIEGWKPGDGDTGVHHYLAGGDFREDRIVNGKVVEPGWERRPGR
jgi:hypothetical protein